MQGQRCAYCEAAISPGYRHVEHFEQRHRRAALTFAWSNLFGSCNRGESCGKHKDHRAGAYNPAHLVKPDVDDPDHFFVFVADGTIQVRDGLSASDERRAKETLRIFNLDAEGGALRHMRRAAAFGYQQTAEEIWMMADEFTEAELRQLIETELNITCHLPFATAIRHTLSRVV